MLWEKIKMMAEPLVILPKVLTLPPSVTVAINKLVKKGYVKKEKSNTDGRVVYVRLTDKGLRIDKIHQYFHVKMVKDISKEMTDEVRKKF